MKPYSDYSAEELAMENLFIRWVRFPDDPSIRTFWENWMIKYPSRKATVERARELVITASDWKPDTLTSQEVNSLWGRIRNSLEIIGDREPAIPSVNMLGTAKTLSKITSILIAVSFLIILFYFLFSTLHQ